MFELLISISGIGPKTALGLLSGITVDSLKSAIMEGNVGRIVSVPGIGKKTAERLILELKSKVGEIREEGGKVLPPTVKHEAIAALTTLGYNIKSAESVVLKVISSEPDCTLEELIKKSLSELNK